MPLTGTRIMPVPEPLKMAELRRQQAKFGRCVVGRHRAVAERFLLRPFNAAPSQTHTRDALKLADSGCMTPGYSMQFPGGSFEFALSDALVRTKLAPLTGLSSLPALDQPTVVEGNYQPKPGERPKPEALKAMAQNRANMMTLVNLLRAGECIVRADPEGAWRLLAIDPTSPTEEAAFAALQPKLAACSGNVPSDRMAIRGTVALNYLRLSRALASTAPSGGLN